MIQARAGSVPRCHPGPSFLTHSPSRPYAQPHRLFRIVVFAFAGCPLLATTTAPLNITFAPVPLAIAAATIRARLHFHFEFSGTMPFLICVKVFCSQHSEILSLVLFLKKVAPRHRPDAEPMTGAPSWRRSVAIDLGFLEFPRLGLQIPATAIAMVAIRESFDIRN